MAFLHSSRVVDVTCATFVPAGFVEVRYCRSVKNGEIYGKLSKSSHAKTQRRRKAFGFFAALRPLCAFAWKQLI
jgi:hypothetical protein